VTRSLLQEGAQGARGAAGEPEDGVRRAVFRALADKFVHPGQYIRESGRVSGFGEGAAQFRGADVDVPDGLAGHLGDPRRSLGEAVLDRGLARGEISADLDRELALDLFAAAVFWRTGVQRVPATPAYLDSLTESLLQMLTP
jgi:hypothetical protein